MGANAKKSPIVIALLAIAVLSLAYFLIPFPDSPEPALNDPSEPADQSPSEDAKTAQNFSARASGRFLDSTGGEVRVVAEFSGETPDLQNPPEASPLIESIPATVESAYKKLESSGFEMPETISLRFAEGARSEFNYSEQTIILPAHSLKSRERLDALILHEMHHVAQLETSGAGFNYPNWFVEGPAEYFRKNGNCNLSMDRLLPLDFYAIQNSNRSYWEGCVATKVLVEELGADLAEIYGDLGSSSLEESLIERANVSYAQLEKMTYEAVESGFAMEGR